jgi:hypothetical protein
MFDRSNPAQVDDEAFEAPEIPSATLRKQDRLSEFRAATSAGLLMTVKHDQLPPRSDWQCLERSLKPAIEYELTGGGTTPFASSLVVRHLHVVDQGSSLVSRRQMSIASKTKTVVQKARRRHRGPSFVFSTKEDRPSGGDFSTHDGITSDTAIPSFAR